MAAPDAETQRVILVTGPSGAGRTTAINALEDLGFEAIDNLPLGLIPRLIDGVSLRPMALGIDARGRDFSPEGLLGLQAQLSNDQRVTVELLYLDCRAEVLLRRFSETRRRHPLSPDDAPGEGIAREMEMLAPVRSGADLLIETSDLTPHDLRAQVQRWFGSETGQGMAVALHSFSYKRGLPNGLDMVFDCRFLHNPFWQKDLRKLTGLDAAVSDYVSRDARHAPFIEKVTDLVAFVLPASVEEGKAHFSVGFGCTGGQHRSVAVTEWVAAALALQGWRVSIRHRELERLGLAAETSRIVKIGGEARN